MIEWHDVKGYEGIYQITINGDVRRLPQIIMNSNRRQKLHAKSIPGFNIKHCIAGRGYKVVYFMVGGKKHMQYIHRLLAEIFIPNPENLSQVNHKDGIKFNNNINNLEWCSNDFNMAHAARIGLMKRKLTTPQVIEIKQRIATGETHRSISIDYGVTPEMISSIKCKKAWAYI